MEPSQRSDQARQAERPLTFHAIYVALGEAEFAEASIRSIYDSVIGITLITNHDVDFHRVPRTPDRLLDDLLSRRYDPERKIDIIVSSETQDARSRNRAMDYADPSGRSRAVRGQHELDVDPPRPDYFLVVDSDEVWEKRHLEGLRAWAARDRLPLYRVPCIRYFRDWTTRIEGYEMTPVLFRPDIRLTWVRGWEAHRFRRGIARFTPMLTLRMRERIRGVSMVPIDVARFHHGSYVGPRERVAAKVSSSPHAHEIRAGWLEEVYDRWYEGMRDFHPVEGRHYPSASRLSVEELPPEIRDFNWPPGYIRKP